MPEPTEEPTEQPSPTTEPTEEPTAKPTSEPTDEPTGEPTAEPTEEPTGKPSPEPTEAPKAPQLSLTKLLKDPATGKLVSEAELGAGETAQFTITGINSGEVAVQPVRLVDTWVEGKAPLDLACQIDGKKVNVKDASLRLEPKQSLICITEYTVTEADVAKQEDLVNKATITGDAVKNKAGARAAKSVTTFSATKADAGEKGAGASASAEAVIKMPAPASTPEPTAEPEPTKEPEPTEAPTNEPTEKPSPEPSENPSEEPSENPSEKPSENPSEAPSEKPSEAPSENPSEEPGEKPSEESSADPTVEASEDPAGDSGSEANEDSADSGSLAATGAQVAGAIAIAVGLIFLGILLTIIMRRRNK